jgi:hypothetical protein
VTAIAPLFPADDAFLQSFINLLRADHGEKLAYLSDVELGTDLIEDATELWLIDDNTADATARRLAKP